MGPISKGFVVLISDRGDGEVLDARVLTMVAIYTAVGIRDAAMNDRIGQALLKSPRPGPAIDRSGPASDSGVYYWLSCRPNFTKGNGFDLSLRAGPDRRADSVRGADA